MAATTPPSDGAGGAESPEPQDSIDPPGRVGASDWVVALERGGKYGVSSPPGAGRILRFDLVERVVHWVNAALFLALVATGAALYLEPIGSLVGRRALVVDIHLACGIALPLPVLVAIAGRWGGFFRRDLGRLNRWSANDRRWLARALRFRFPLPRSLVSGVGKFNAGQKLNAAFVAGAGLVMLGTGLIMEWYHPWPLAWRTGATFVHDWLALALGLVIIGHIGMALRDPDSLGSMVRGSISRKWADRHAPVWVAEVDASQGEKPVPAASRKASSTSR
jgi:formate dehydrogenase subunit gamma